jgi:hypothetical protein
VRVDARRCAYMRLYTREAIMSECNRNIMTDGSRGANRHEVVAWAFRVKANTCMKLCIYMPTGVLG